MKDEVMKHFEALAELMPGVGIVLIPEDEELPLRTNISSIEDGTRVMQHLAAVIHLFQSRELYDAVLDSFERATSGHA